jgi:integrase
MTENDTLATASDLRLWTVLDPDTCAEEGADRLLAALAQRGNRLLPDNFRHIMIDAYRAVEGLKCGLANGGGVTAHGLRCTAAVVMREMGCDWETIASITGHATIQMVKKYLEKKRLAQLGVDALNRAARIRLEQSERNESGSGKH